MKEGKLSELLRKFIHMKDVLRRLVDLQNGKIHCNNPLGLGSCASGLTPVVGDTLDSRVQNCKLARGCGITWDGITSSTANQGNPYC